eukprot:2356709-Alexandrium_andersonii.AAC.1
MCSGSELQECPLVTKCSPRGFRVLVVAPSVRPPPALLLANRVAVSDPTDVPLSREPACRSESR